MATWARYGPSVADIVFWVLISSSGVGFMWLLVDSIRSRRHDDT